MSEQGLPVCVGCGSTSFVDSGPAQWTVVQRSALGSDVTRSLAGRLVACRSCGRVETFLDDPQALLGFPGSREIAGVAGGVPHAAPTSSDWQVVLLAAGPTPIGLIATLRQELPLDLATARGAISKLPWVLTRTSNRRVADSLCEKLAALGAVVHVEPA